MIIDNFDLMQSILKPESTDDFWFGQIIARRKDVKDLPRADKWIKSYYIKDFDHSKSKESEIKKKSFVMYLKLDSILIQM